MNRFLLLPRKVVSRANISFADIVVFLGFFALLYGTAKVGSGFFEAFTPPHDLPQIDLSPRSLLYYTARSGVRMFAALAISLVIALASGYAAAKNKKAESVILPLLDIGQSVPILGFLAVTVDGFISLFPGSVFGLECASIFAIVTCQMWNMAFSFYFSVKTLPKELDDASRVFRMSKWRRFVSLEVPYSMTGMVWNAMMSFGGGWFYVTASEAIQYSQKKYYLPGIGSYVAKAFEVGNVGAVVWASLTIIVVIVCVDQLFWRPVMAWAEKFQAQPSAAGEYTSWALDLLRAAQIPLWLNRRLRRIRSALFQVTLPKLPSIPKFKSRKKQFLISGDVLFGVVVGGTIVAALFLGTRYLQQELPVQELGVAALGGLATLLRVAALLALASVIWTPVGVWIGFNPRVARRIQPVVQILSSYPFNFLFPVIAFGLDSVGVHMSLTATVLMALGSQWYILFNSIAGAVEVPQELRQMADSFGLKKWLLWKRLIIPAIFPSWVTGAITATGGAWNASILCEIVMWKDKTLAAPGLGTYITTATAANDWPRIVLGVMLMCVIVVAINRLVWQRLYDLAETRYKMS
ncbi:MAG: ABC transporter permease subunit [Fimbriimonadaceae bacterium]|nr:ABC transporter permease subunit [Fimbriimonadaceae bacterium]